MVIQRLIRAIKEGKISKRVARLIFRRLLRAKKLVSPELLDLIRE